MDPQSLQEERVYSDAKHLRAVPYLDLSAQVLQNQAERHFRVSELGLGEHIGSSLHYFLELFDIFLETSQNNPRFTYLRP